MPTDPDVPSGLVADLYDAAIRDSGLGTIAETLGGYMGVAGAAIVLQRGGEPPEAYSSAVIAEQNHLYGAYYHRLDPWRPRGFVPGLDRVALTSELYPESDLVRTEFYADFARPMGMFRPLAAYLHLGEGRMAALGVEQPFATRLFEAQDKHRLERVMPFLKRALQLRLDVKAARREADLGFKALDALAVGVAVCGVDGRIVHANAPARALARHGLRVGEPGAPVGALREDDTRRLMLAIRQAAGGHRGSLRLTGAGGLHVVTLATPLPDGLAASEGHVMLTLRPESGVPSPSPAVLRSLYGLSEAQALLCVSLAAGKTFEQSAAERNVTTATMRSHFTAVLARTGTRNLRDLLRLLGTLPPMTE